MVYVSHQAGELRRIATTVVRLDGGRVIATWAVSSCSMQSKLDARGSRDAGSRSNVVSATTVIAL